MAASGSNIVIPQAQQLQGMDAKHRAAIISFAQSVKPFVDNQLKGLTGAAGAQATQLGNLAAQLAAIKQQLVQLQNQVNSLVSGGTGGFPVVGTFTKAVGVGAFPVAVYESAPGVADLADNAAFSTLYPTLGIATGSASGGQVFVTVLGEVKNPAWAWTAEQPVYVGAGGALTQVEPANPVIVGYATSGTSIFVDVSYPSTASGGTIPTTMQADLIIADYTQLLFHEEIVMQAGQEIRIGVDADLVAV